MMPAQLPLVKLEQLLRLQGRKFVTAVYLQVLGREPDSAGLNHHLDLLRAGETKFEVVRRIRSSKEGALIGVRISGYSRAIMMWRLGALPFIGCIFSYLDELLSISPVKPTIRRQTIAEMQAATLDLEVIRDQLVHVQHILGSPQFSYSSASSMEMLQAVSEVVISQQVKEPPIVLRLAADRSTDEPSWLQYLGEVIRARLLVPLNNEGTPPPDARLLVAIDCTGGAGSPEQQARTIASVTALVAASEYPIKAVWYGETQELNKAVSRENSSSNFPQFFSSAELCSYVQDRDLILVIRCGDEVRPELHMALKYFGAFNADFTLIDMYYRDAGRIYPLLLHAVDPIHAAFCDYFLGRFVANGGRVKQRLVCKPELTLTSIGLALCVEAGAESPAQTKHISIPLICANTSNAALALQRAALILDVEPGISYSAGPNDAPKFALLAEAANSRQASVSAIICTKNCGLLLQQLLHRLLSEPLILDIIIVSNNTTNVHALRTLAGAATSEKITILKYDSSFNFSRQCNLGAKYANGKTLLFLNDDISPVSNDWLQRLHSWMDTPKIVGPLLIYPNESVQHAGMHLGFNGAAGHVLRHSRLPSGDYGFLLTAPRHVSCLTGAVLMMPKVIFESLNGFDAMLATYLQDVDLSLRALFSGVQLVFDPRCILIHMESVSVTPKLTEPGVQKTRELEFSYFQKRWAATLEHDTWMNPLFDVNDESRTVLRV